MQSAQVEQTEIDREEKHGPSLENKWMTSDYPFLRGALQADCARVVGGYSHYVGWK
jgi:hypothetical protein